MEDGDLGLEMWVVVFLGKWEGAVVSFWAWDVWLFGWLFGWLCGLGVFC